MSVSITLPPCCRGVARRRVPGPGFRHGEDLAGADLLAALATTPSAGALPVCSIFIAFQVIGKFPLASMIMLICGCWHVFLPTRRPPVQLD